MVFYSPYENAWSELEKKLSEVFERLNVTVYYGIKNVETGIIYATS
jgi:hypothetical protein